MHWPEEHSTSVLRRRAILDAELTVGMNCMVNIGRKKCRGQVLGTGKLFGMLTHRGCGTVCLLTI